MIGSKKCAMGSNLTKKFKKSSKKYQKKGAKSNLGKGKLLGLVVTDSSQRGIYCYFSKGSQGNQDLELVNSLVIS